MTTTPDFRALCAELLDELDLWSSWHDAPELKARTRAALATPPPEPALEPMPLPGDAEGLAEVFWSQTPFEPPTTQITFNAPPSEEVIRLDKDGFHYKDQFIADAGEAHRLMVEFLKQNAKTKPEPPTDEELRKLWLDLYATNDGPTSGEVVVIARAVLERWGNG